MEETNNTNNTNKTNENNKTLNLAEGALLPTLLKFMIPILLSLMLQTAYGTIDLFIVGKFSSIADISGVTIGSQLLQTITATCSGLAMGSTILIGKYIGANEKDNAGKSVGTSIYIFTRIAIVLAIIIVLTRDLILNIMQTPIEAFAQASSYLFYCGIGIIFIVCYNLLGSIFRGIGDSKTPLMAVFIAFIVNVILDLVFVAGLKMGASGAALATTFAQASSVLLSLIVINKKNKNKELPFEFNKKYVSFDKYYAGQIVKLGSPVALQVLLVSISFLTITAITNKFGVEQSAAVGIVEKITTMVMLIPSAFMQALSAFVAQNYGAGKLERTTQGLKYSILISFIFGVIMAYFSIFHGTIFTRLFIDDVVNAETTKHALLYLKSYSIDVVLVAFLFSFIGYFNGFGKTTFVMIQAVAGAFLVRIPLAIILSNLENTNLFIIGLATPLSTLLQIIVFVIYYINFQKKLKNENI